MKNILLITLVLIVGCVLATGCVGQINKDPAPVKCVCPACPTLNATTKTVSNMTGTEANITKLKGPLRVTINGYPASLPVTIDNQTAGVVTQEKPLDLMLDEGSHAVKVCVGVICENETVNIEFAKRTTVDFGDRLRKAIEFPYPTARIVDYYRSGDAVVVILEFTNPSAKDVTMSAEVGLGYTLISDKTYQRIGESTRGKAFTTVKAGQHLSYNLRLDFASGTSYMFDPPVLGQVTTN
jgi:hypothetical protein